MAAKIFIDSVFRGKILWSLKISPKILTAKKIFLTIKNLSENFTDWTFIRNLGGFTKKCQKKMALGALFFCLSIGQNFGRGKFWPKSFASTNLGSFPSLL